MIVTVADTALEVASVLADRIVAAVRANPATVLGLPTGRTPVAAYAELVRRHRARLIDLGGVTTFNLDEFVGIPASHPGSFRQFMQRQLFEAIAIDPGRIHFLNGAASDLEGECRRYEKDIERAGGIDLQLLGIGANGHIGFNEPADGLIAMTHRVRLFDSTRRDNASLFGGDAASVPAEALTMGVGTILRSRRIVLAAVGETKARCIAGTVNGAITTQLPASFLQLHPEVEVVIDRAAAALL